MSAECQKCGHDLSYDLGCTVCDLRDEVEVLRKALKECTRLSGADLSDGFPTWPPLHEFAVQMVHQLRADYDEEPGGAA